MLDGSQPSGMALGAAPGEEKPVSPGVVAEREPHPPPPLGGGRWRVARGAVSWTAGRVRAGTARAGPRAVSRPAVCQATRRALCRAWSRGAWPPGSCRRPSTDRAWGLRHAPPQRGPCGCFERTRHGRRAAASWRYGAPCVPGRGSGWVGIRHDARRPAVLPICIKLTPKRLCNL